MSTRGFEIVKPNMRRTGGEMLMIVTMSEEPMLVRPRDEDGGDAG